MKEKKGLGRGLSALLLPKKGQEERAEEILQIDIENIKTNPYQPRRNFDEEKIKELAETIKEKGIIEPLIVRKAPLGYELISGERRLRAAKMAGLKRVPCIVRPAGEEETLELALIENLQREDLNPLEEARAYKMLKERFGLTQEEIAKKVGKDRATVANSLRLLKLPEEILQGLSEGKISEGHAKLLLSVDQREAIELFKKIVKDGLSVRAVEKILKREKYEKKKEEDPNLRKVIKEMERFLEAKVEIYISKNGKGRILIKFSNVEHLNQILDKIGIRDTL